jgi:ABC-type bacteriocin/lantibiotic exporter with double-glycine peptidase domain
LLHWLSLPDIKTRPIFEGFQYAFGLLVVRIFGACLNGLIAYQLGRETLRVRTLLIAAVYRKSLRLSPSERGKKTIGDIVSHINVDAEVICGGSWFIHVITMTLPSFGLGVYLLYAQLQWVAFVGLGFILVILFGTQGFNSRAMGITYSARLKELDKRTTLVDEAIMNMKLIKFSAWETPLRKRVMELRDREMMRLKTLANIFGRIVTPSTFARGGTLLLMFVLYTVKIHTPTASTIFVSLTIFDILYVPMEQSGFTLEWLLSVKESIARIRDFLAADELEADAVQVDPSLTEEGFAARIEDGLFSWIKEEADDSVPKSDQLQLDIPHLSVRQGELLVILGRVGSGKSSLLEALTGQMHRKRGIASLASKKIAYCPQIPFIMAGSVQANILGFDLPLDKDLLDRVVEACALQEDLKQLPGGLRCEIGERGINLSGGQR